jgi:hypothetical protein
MIREVRRRHGRRGRRAIAGIAGQIARLSITGVKGGSGPQDVVGSVLTSPRSRRIVRDSGQSVSRAKSAQPGMIFHEMVSPAMSGVG